MVDVRDQLAALDSYRIAHDLSWRALTAEMSALRCGVPSRTLHYLCRRVHDDASVRDRTIIKIRKFLRLKNIRRAKKRRRPLPANVPVRQVHA